MAVVTTGSCVQGLIPGMNKHMGGGCSLMYILGNPDGLLTAPEDGSSPSGTSLAYDSANNQIYQHVTGSTWQKLGSVA